MHFRRTDRKHAVGDSTATWRRGSRGLAPHEFVHAAHLDQTKPVSLVKPLCRIERFYVQAGRHATTMRMSDHRAAQTTANTAIAPIRQQADFHQSRFRWGRMNINAPDQMIALKNHHQIGIGIVCAVMRMLRLELRTTKRGFRIICPRHGRQLISTRLCEQLRTKFAVPRQLVTNMQRTAGKRSAQRLVKRRNDRQRCRRRRRYTHSP